ncbi:MAG: hypothetical protein ACRD3Q_20790 [Terriglobales bacterium]
MMTREERTAVIDLRVELSRYVRACPGCGGAGQLRRVATVTRYCPLCRCARKALEASERVLLPAGEAVGG